MFSQQQQQPQLDVALANVAAPRNGPLADDVIVVPHCDDGDGCEGLYDVIFIGSN